MQVEFEDWVRVFNSAVDAGVFDLGKLPTLRASRQRLQDEAKKRVEQQRQWGTKDDDSAIAELKV